MDESYKSGVFRVTFEVEVIVNGGHHGEAIVSAYQRLGRLISGAERASRVPGHGGHFDVKSDNLRDDSAWFNQAEIKQVWQDWGPESEEAKLGAQPGDCVRMWLEDSSVRGTLYLDPVDGLSVALVEDGVDPLNAAKRFQSYPAKFRGRDRRMEVVERASGRPNDGD